MSAAARMIRTTLVLKKKVARKAAIITRICRGERSRATLLPRLNTTSNTTAATPACMPFSTKAT